MTRRLEMVQDQIKEEVSRLLRFKAKDPRFGLLNVTRVKLTKDLRHAVVFYSIMDDSVDKTGVKEGLSKATSFFRREVGKAVRLKFVPAFQFEFDNSMEYAQHIENVLNEVGRQSRINEENGSDDT
jgi:ribosome-binding factor A